MTTPHDNYTCQQLVARAYDNGHADGIEEARLGFERGWDRMGDIALEIVRTHIGNTTGARRAREQIEAALLQLQDRPQWREEQTRQQIADKYESDSPETWAMMIIVHNDLSVGVFGEPAGVDVGQLVAAIRRQLGATEQTPAPDQATANNGPEVSA